MAQFDVYVNPHPGSRDRVPYLVDVQSRLLSQASTRLTLPLRRYNGSHEDLPRRLVPKVRVLAEDYVVYAHQAAAIEVRHLKKPVATLAAQAADLIGAVDAVISGI